MALQVFSEHPNNPIDTSEQPFFVTLCAPAGGVGTGSMKIVRTRPGPEVGFEVGPDWAKPLVDISFRPDSITGVPGLGELSLSLRKADPTSYAVYARRVRKRRPGGLPELEGDPLDWLQVWNLSPYRLGISFLNIQSHPGRNEPWFITETQCQELVAGANSILQTQLNVEFVLENVRTKPLSGVDQGVPYFKKYRGSYHKLPPPLASYTVKGYPCIAGRPPNPLGCDPGDPALSAVQDPMERMLYMETNFNTALLTTPNLSDFDVYVVRRLLAPTPDDSGVGAYNLVADRQCVFPMEKNSGKHWAQAGVVLAHEIGHWLFAVSPDNRGDHHPRQDNLMDPAGRGRHLTRYQIRTGRLTVELHFMNKRP